MSRGFPSMTALLGLLAIAGYQNRDKLQEMLGGGQQPAGPGGSGRDDDPRVQNQQGGLGGLLGGRSGNTGASGQAGGLGGLLGGLGAGGAGGLLGSGLSELMENFRQNGQGDVAESWVASGPNKQVAPDQLERAIGADTLDDLARQTGLPRDEILARLSRELPDVVDRYTPEGRLPSDGTRATM
jgi:uncharacterized protein YidB (DUF937 family)